MTAAPGPARGADPGKRPPLRMLFVNSGILGHAAVAGLFVDVARRIPGLDATHINLSDDLTLAERAIRRVLSLPWSPKTGWAGNLDLRRWRQELNVGLLARRRIAAAERAGHYDMMHFHTQATAYACLGRLRTAPAIVSIDATQQIASLEATSAIGRMSYAPNMIHDGRVFRAAAAITVTSEWAAKDLRAHYPECSERVHVMPYPVQVWGRPEWMAERAGRATSRRVSPTRVLFIGGDFPRKGGFDLLEAWRVGRFADRAVLDLVTDWPIAAADLPQGVGVVRGIRPHTSAWTELWRQADVFAMPTRHEAFGLVFQEAAAAGLPVLATAINAVPEIVLDGVTGLLVAPGDHEGLVAGLRALVDDPTRRERLGRAAMHRVRADASPEQYAARLATVISRITTI